MREFDAGVDELVVQGDGDGGAEAEGDSHASEGDSEGELGIALDDCALDLEADEEEEKAETDGGGEAQEGARLVGEDVFGEPGYATYEMVNAVELR